MNTLKSIFKILFAVLLVAVITSSCSTSKTARGKGCGCALNKGFVGY